MDSATLSDSIGSFNRDPEEFAGENDGHPRVQERTFQVSPERARRRWLPGEFFENGDISPAATSGSRLNNVTFRGLLMRVVDHVSVVLRMDNMHSDQAGDEYS